MEIYHVDALLHARWQYVERFGMDLVECVLVEGRAERVILALCVWNSVNGCMSD